MDASVSLERIRTYVARHRGHLATPGLALAVTDRRRCLGVVLDGLANVDSGTPIAPDHRFQIGSISKGFTALALLQQVEQGRLDLDAPITEYLPWFEVRSVFEPITVHHLLSHTAGLVAGTDFTGDAASEVWSLRETETGFAPGERFLYSNVGYKALGLALEAVTGRPWWETVHERVMAPTGMGEADVVITHGSRARLAVGYTSPFDDRPWLPRHGWAPSPWFESATADGTICATAEELTAYARLLLAGGEGVVSPGSFERMTTPVGTDLETGDRYGYGIKWTEQSGRSLLGHSGGMIGFSTYLLVDPGSGFGVTALTNSAFGRRLDVAVFALGCLRAEGSGETLPEIPVPHDPTRVEGAADYAGTYLGGTNDVEIAVADRLILHTAGRSAVLVPTEVPDVFLVDDPELERHAIRFLREESLVTGAFWGPGWMHNERYTGAVEFEHPSEWEAYPGRYASWNPWLAGFRVFLRRGVLWLGLTGDASDVGEGERPLTPIGDGVFRVGEDWSPDRVRFGMVVDERAQRAVFDAAPFYRTFAG